jgi:hypothetical protein
VELRPELMPPLLDAEKVSRLTQLAEGLDGVDCRATAPVPWANDLAEFNRLAETTFDIYEFQDIYESQTHHEWVRSMLYTHMLKPTPNLSLAEMTEIVFRVVDCAANWDFFLKLFEVNCKHPSGNGLIYWPNLVPELPQDREPTAEEIAELALRGRSAI